MKKIPSLDIRKEESSIFMFPSLCPSVFCGLVLDNGTKACLVWAFPKPQGAPQQHLQKYSKHSGYGTRHISGLMITLCLFMVL